VHIAWQAFGSGSVEVEFVPGCFSNVELVWNSPWWKRFFTRLGTFSRILLFDKRDSGLSDRVQFGAVEPSIYAASFSHTANAVPSGLVGKVAMKPPAAADRAAMHTIATIRKVSDYQIFVDAYREWHGSNPEENEVEADFGRYLRLGVVPKFVRHYLRNYKNRHPQEMASYRRELAKAKRLRQAAFWLIVLMVIIALTL
jgi:hypothetical protein